MSILLVGVGGFGKNHLRVWRELNQELYVCDLDARALAICQTYDIPADHQGTAFESFLDRVRAVDIVTPTPAHFELVRACLEAGKDVFVEKPITLSSDQALALQQLKTKTQRIVQVGHIFRFNPASQYIKAAITQQRLGPVHYLQGLFKGFKRMRTDVGVTQTDSIHFFDLFNWFLDQRPVAVTAVTRDYGRRRLDAFSHVFLEYDNGVVAHVESGYFDPQTYRHVTIVGERAALSSDIVAQKVELFHQCHVARDGQLVAVSSGTEQPAITTKEPLELELRAFLHSLETREEPLAGVEEGYVTLKITEAAYESSRTGRRVTVEYAKPAELHEAHRH